MKLAAAIAVAVLILDQVTKLVALERLAPGLPVTVVDGLISLTLVMNPGLAFGLLGGVPAAWRWIVALLSLVALLMLARVALRVLPTGGWQGVVGIGWGDACWISSPRLGVEELWSELASGAWFADVAITVFEAIIAFVIYLAVFWLGKPENRSLNRFVDQHGDEEARDD